MDKEERIQVTEWAEPVLEARRTPAGWSPIPWIIGLGGTILLHIAMIPWLGLALFGGRGGQERLANSAESAGLIVTFLHAAPRTDDLSLEGIPAFKGKIENAPLLLKPPRLAVNRLAVDDDRGLDGDAEDPELAQAEQIYQKQITARIERVWEMPSVGKSSLREFHCQAQVEQDSTGRVTEVLLPSCEADSYWRSSLLQAIRAASPLPAPPDPRVYSPALVLRFDVASQRLVKQTTAR